VGGLGQDLETWASACRAATETQSGDEPRWIESLPPQPDPESKLAALIRGVLDDVDDADILDHDSVVTKVFDPSAGAALLQQAAIAPGTEVRPRGRGTGS
jgi:hypothetical protein